MRGKKKGNTWKIERKLGDYISHPRLHRCVHLSLCACVILASKSASPSVWIITHSNGGHNQNVIDHYSTEQQRDKALLKIRRAVTVPYAISAKPALSSMETQSWNKSTSTELFHN